VRDVLAGIILDHALFISIYGAIISGVLPVSGKGIFVGTGRPATMAMNGMISTPHYLASQAGLRVLREGGNAVDAAIAANAVLTVVMPDNCSIGGDAFFMIWDPEKGELNGLNGSGRAPAGSTIEAVRENGNNQMPDRGPWTVTVPGAVEAWGRVHERYGSRPLDSLLLDAILYAHDGFPVTPHLSAAIKSNAEMLKKDSAASRQFMPDGNPPASGSILKQPALAASLREIVRHGPEAIYSGKIGARIVRSLNTCGSPITTEDLASQQSEWVTPISSTYRGYTVFEMPPNTQGITALQMLNIAEGWSPDEMPDASTCQVHHFVEAKKHAFVDRDRYISDPKFVDVPVDHLISKEYAGTLRSKIDPEQAWIQNGARPGAGDTVYLCAFDRNGMAVSLIQSLFRGFGSGIVAEGTGIVLQNRGASFSLDPDAANSLQPGKRPMHTLIPGMIFEGGRPWSVFGCMGGHGQAQTHLQLVNRLIDHGLNPQAAIEAPRWVAGPEVSGDPEHLVRVEPEFGEEVIDELQSMGHEVRVTESMSSAMGHAQAIHVDWGNGVLVGGADPRANGYALGW
jgi:gamma-glutamyltranspeptidase / glutathione hydrolase